jgi:two-component system nitrogen regulation sensor histidine kinase NtrY
MGSKPPLGFAFALAWRSAAIGLLAFAGLLALQHGFYATTLVLAGLIVLTGLDIARRAKATDRMLAAFIDGLNTAGAEWPTPPLIGLPEVARAMAQAKGRTIGRHVQASTAGDYMQSLVDSVTAVLLVIEGEGPPAGVNLAARRMAGHEQGALGLAVALGPDALARISALRPGTSNIVRLADGGARLASCSGFNAPGSAPRRLIALQRLEGDLDAVQLKSWRDLVRVISHELMNSLTAICSLAETGADLLRKGQADGPAVAEAVEIIGRRSSGLMDFVERYRRVADLPEPRLEPLAAADLVATVDRLMGGLMAEAGVAYGSRITPEGLTMSADRNLIEQAIINLLKNALEATAGRETPLVRLSVSLDPDGIGIEVSDNGPGLPPRAQDALFVPFFTTKPGSSGIGLTLARQIALAHGGRLEYLGGRDGASFRLLLSQSPAPGERPTQPDKAKGPDLAIWPPLVWWS